MLIMMLNKMDWKAWTLFTWLRVRRNEGILGIEQQTFGFNEMHVIS
jgi:hypothetical protein